MDPGLHTQKNVMRFLHGFSFFFKGIRFITKHSLWKYTVIPSLLSLITSLFLILFVFTEISHSIISRVGHSDGMFSGIIVAAVWIFSAFLSFLITILLYRIISSLLVTPFLGTLLEKTIFILHENMTKQTILTEIKNIFYTIWINLKFSIIGIVFLIISLPLGPFQIFVMIFVEGYFLGRASFDPVFETESVNIHERNSLVKQHFYEILGLGSAFFLFLMVPAIGILIAPAAGMVGAAMIRHGKIVYEHSHER